MLFLVQDPITVPEITINVDKSMGFPGIQTAVKSLLLILEMTRASIFGMQISMKIMMVTIPMIREMV